MYDTATHVEMVKKRIRQRQRNLERYKICSLFSICVLLSVVLVGVMGTLTEFAQATLPGMYGSMLLREGVGGYVLVGVLAFTAAVVITVLCIKYQQKKKKREKEDKKE